MAELFPVIGLFICHWDTCQWERRGEERRGEERKKLPVVCSLEQEPNMTVPNGHKGANFSQLTTTEAYDKSIT